MKFLPAALVLLIFSSALCAQERIGELRLSVTDTAGAALGATCRLKNIASAFALSFETSTEREYNVKKLSFGRYQLTVAHPGFAPTSTIVVIRSAIPLQLTVTLSVASRTDSITVFEADTLLDTINTGPAYEVGRSGLLERASSPPGRDIISVVDAQPGWLAEANGVLHPRGSEYEVQYVADGMPMLDNRSPSFSAGEDIEDLQSVRVFTSAIPAEFGRKLGGVVETVTDRNPARGFHGRAVAGGGSFRNASGHLGAGCFDGSNAFHVSAHAAHTDRFLDPVVQQNYTNRADLAGFSASFERDLGQNDRVRLVINHNFSRFLVPNDYLQQDAGQRQHRENYETGGQAFYEHTFSSSLLSRLQGRVRDVSTGLQSNDESIPVVPFQQRGFREGYAKGSIDLQRGRHEVKVGGDALYTAVHEFFSYRITAPTVAGQPLFDPTTPASFSFRGAALDREQSWYAQDQISLGNVSLSAGLRFDNYNLRVSQTAWSPRLSVAWYVPKTHLVLRASYDRIFGTPAIENLLLSTSSNVRMLSQAVTQLPLNPSRGNYYEVGVTKEVFRNARWSVNYYRRNIRNFADDDTLLNTGIAFPIALRSASISGAESQFVLAALGPFSAWVNYSYMLAKAQLPAVGGLFLGKEAASLLNSTDRIWSTQDQRHTAHAQIRFQPANRFWSAFGAEYGSGLPVELSDQQPEILAEEVGQAVVDRVDLDRGRVRPSFSLNLSAGLQLWRKEKRALQLQGDVQNLTDRLNVINFANVFSGTALASPRAGFVRLRFDF